MKCVVLLLDLILILILISVSVLLWFTLLYEHKKCRNMKQKDLKAWMVLRTYDWLRQRREDGRDIGKQLNKRYDKIAIYGLGRIGRELIEELLKEGVYVAFCVDQSYKDKLYRNIPCFNTDVTLPHADILIITIPSEADEIKKQITPLALDIDTVKSIQEVLYAL